MTGNCQNCRQLPDELEQDSNNLLLWSHFTNIQTFAICHMLVPVWQIWDLAGPRWCCAIDVVPWKLEKGRKGGFVKRPPAPCLWFRWSPGFLVAQLNSTQTCNSEPITAKAWQSVKGRVGREDLQRLHLPSLVLWINTLLSPTRLVCYNIGCVLYIVD